MLLLIDSSKGYEEYLSGLPNKSAELKNLENEQIPYSTHTEWGRMFTCQVPQLLSTPCFARNSTLQ